MFGSLGSLAPTLTVSTSPVVPEPPAAVVVVCLWRGPARAQEETQVAPPFVEVTDAAGIQAVIQKAHLEKLATQGDAGQKRLHKLLRSTAAKAVDEQPDPRWRRIRTKASADRTVQTPS